MDIETKIDVKYNNFVYNSEKFVSVMVYTPHINDGLHQDTRCTKGMYSYDI